MAPSESAPNGVAQNGHTAASEKERPLPTPLKPKFAATLKSRTLLQVAAALVLDYVEWVLDLLNYQPQEDYFLSGNFAPVQETLQADTGLKITGALPEYLRGEFVRVTPNPKYRPITGYHWFDGDGMLHGVRFSDKTASYARRYVQTSRLAQETAYGKPVFLKIGQMKGITGLLRLTLFQARAYMGLVDVKLGSGTGNTAVTFHGGSLLALNEGDMPYAIRMLQDGDLENLGRQTYGGKLNRSLTAHPKLDPVTGELYTYGYDVQKAPYVRYHVISPTGNISPAVPITIPEPAMMHDFAITERHAIFMDLPCVFDAKEMVVKGTVPFAWREGRAARFGLLPRGDRTEANIRWFSRPPCFIFHTGNAWEEEDEVVLIACRFNRLNMTELSANAQDPGFLTEFRFNLKSGGSEEQQLSGIRCDFPRINEGLIGRKSRYMYAVAVDNIVDLVGVVKFDLSKKPKLLDSTIPLASTAEIAAAEVALGGCVTGFFSFGPGRLGSESVFVPRAGAPPTLAEDDGCIISMVYDSRKNLSEVVVIDAKTFSPNPLAIVHLTTRVPYGFHGTFVSEEQLEHQI